MHSQCRTLATSVIWETRMITDKEIITDNLYLTVLNYNYFVLGDYIISIYVCVCCSLHSKYGARKLTVIAESVTLAQCCSSHCCIYT